MISPHSNTDTLRSGLPMAEAHSHLIMVHGRGAGAEDMLGLADELSLDGFSVAAPQAAGRSWYPHSFLAPIESNQPSLDSALARIEGLVDEARDHGLSADRVFLLGFSQGACLSLEYLVRSGTGLGGVIGLSGGLIGPPGTVWDTTGRLDGIRVFIGCSDVDAHIPVERVEETAAVMEALGAQVDKRIYPGMAHTVNLDEIDAVNNLLEGTS